jgi:hypothetical protein
MRAFARLSAERLLSYLARGLSFEDQASVQPTALSLRPMRFPGGVGVTAGADRFPRQGRSRARITLATKLTLNLP